MALTEQQDRAFAFLNDRFGDASILRQTEADATIEARDEDGDVRARWVVTQNGSIVGAWDPDRALDVFLERP